jgi:hypothetical protein
MILTVQPVVDELASPTSDNTWTKKRRPRKGTPQNCLAIRPLSKHGRRGRFPPHPMPNVHTLGALTGPLGRRPNCYKLHVLYTNSQKNAKSRLLDCWIGPTRSASICRKIASSVSILVARRRADVFDGGLQVAVGSFDLASRLFDVDSQVFVAGGPSPFGPNAKRLGVLRVVLNPIRKQHTLF